MTLLQEKWTAPVYDLDDSIPKLRQKSKNDKESTALVQSVAKPPLRFNDFLTSHLSQVYFLSMISTSFAVAPLQ